MPQWLTQWLPRRVWSIPFRPLLYAALAALLALVWLAGALQLWLERNSYLALAETACENLSLALGEYTHQTLQNIDNTLQDIAAQSPRWSAPERQRAAAEYLRNLAERDSTIRSIRLYDRTGQLWLASEPVRGNAPRVDQREDFLAHQAGTTPPLHIGLPRRNVEGEWRYPISRRLAGARGEFQGIAVANLESDTFERFFATLDVGTDGLVTLLRRDSVLLIRRPRLDSGIGRLPVNATIPALAAHSPRGAFTFTSLLDGIYRIGYYRTVPEFPLIASVSMSLEHALQPWRRLVVQFVVTLFGISVAVFLLGWAVSRQHALLEQAEARVRERQHQLEGIASNMPAVVFQRVRRPDGTAHYSFINPKVLEVFGVEPEQVLKGVTALNAITHPDDVSRIRETFEQSARDLSAWSLEFRIRPPNQGQQWLRGAATPRPGPSGEVVWDGVYFNITAERLAEDQLQRSHRMETVGQLARGVAHQFNNLLMSIQGYLELIQLDSAADHPAVRSAAAALEAVQRGAALTRQLLAFSRRQRLEPTVFDLNGALRDAGEFLAGLMDKAIHLDFSLQAELPGVRVDRSQFQTAIVALALNAQEAMPKGGTLTVSTAVEEVSAAQAAAAFVTPGRYVIVRVRDSGAGMSDSVQLRAFEPFFSTKGMGEGTGLGLSQVHGFMKQSGGHTTLRSLPGQGTEVALYFPIQDGPAVDRPPDDAAAAVPGAGDAKRFVPAEKG
jgi:signal transduction histidine kinase